ncbi:MAG: methionyl-tRNA formyltransferase, partial [Proteobacteria bacterium]|nr:methionyl-tRNA formyltransferase [Pseudomonadota bacterium]
EKGELTPVPQDHDRATYAPVLVREDGLIDWGMEAAQIANRVRGFTPWPGTYSTLRGKRMLITSARALSSTVQGSPGEIIGAREGGLDVFCGKDLLRILTIKPEGKREMTAPEFLAGWHLTRGDRFGG